MREIKFRFLHYEDGVKTLHRNITGIDYDEQYNIYNARTTSGEWILNGVPIQYTGLKDKNGCEIYEGDIMHHVNDHGTYEWLTEIVFNDGMFTYRWPEGFICTIAPIIDLKRAEIIGNIHENPELLGDGRI